jgi:hypothetical protein
MWFKLWDLWRMKKLYLNLDIHGDKILELILLTFGFGGSNVCTTFYFYTFPYDNTIIIWIDGKK